MSHRIRSVRRQTVHSNTVRRTHSLDTVKPTHVGIWTMRSNSTFNRFVLKTREDSKNRRKVNGGYVFNSGYVMYDTHMARQRYFAKHLSRAKTRLFVMCLRTHTKYPFTISLHLLCLVCNCGRVCLSSSLSNWCPISLRIVGVEQRAFAMQSIHTRTSRPDEMTHSINLA